MFRHKDLSLTLPDSHLSRIKPNRLSWKIFNYQFPLVPFPFFFHNIPWQSSKSTTPLPQTVATLSVHQNCLPFSFSFSFPRATRKAGNYHKTIRVFLQHAFRRDLIIFPNWGKFFCFITRKERKRERSVKEKNTNTSSTLYRLSMLEQDL